ncbi:MAG: division/cell wall cluster transcriptional repressor MraZ [Thermodesulfobacteriaceae bacterium]|jgi:MraZ protein
MFRGKFIHSVDDKGRISLPARFREVLRMRYGSETLIITNLPECLVAYPFEEWKKLEERLLSIPWSIKEGREFIRYFLGSAEECQPDKQGRLLLPQALREEYNLHREVCLLGMLTYFEIWHPERLKERFKDVKENFNQILETVNSYFADGKAGSS